MRSFMRIVPRNYQNVTVHSIGHFLLTSTGICQEIASESAYFWWRVTGVVPPYRPAFRASGVIRWSGRSAIRNIISPCSKNLWICACMLQKIGDNSVSMYIQPIIIPVSYFIRHMVSLAPKPVFEFMMSTKDSRNLSHDSSAFKL